VTISEARTLATLVHFLDQAETQALTTPDTGEAAYWKTKAQDIRDKIHTWEERHGRQAPSTTP
jgi:hypothetical protein